MLTLAFALAAAELLYGTGSASAQYGAVYIPPPQVSYYTPVVSYYQPAVSYYAAAPAVAYYVPAVAYPPVVSYYTPAVSYYAPVRSYYAAPSAVTTTYYGWFGRPRATVVRYYP
jgi:hypothetical protein